VSFIGGKSEKWIVKPKLEGFAFRARLECRWKLQHLMLFQYHKERSFSVVWAFWYTKSELHKKFTYLFSYMLYAVANSGKHFQFHHIKLSEVFFMFHFFSCFRVETTTKKNFIVNWPSLSIIYALERWSFFLLHTQKKRFFFRLACVTKVTQSPKVGTEWRKPRERARFSSHVCHIGNQFFSHSRPTPRQCIHNIAYFSSYIKTLLHTPNGYNMKKQLHNKALCILKTKLKKNTFTNLVFLIQYFFIVQSRQCIFQLFFHVKVSQRFECIWTFPFAVFITQYCTANVWAQHFFLAVFFVLSQKKFNTNMSHVLV
jgi:hypothetical protein